MLHIPKVVSKKAASLSSTVVKSALHNIGMPGMGMLLSENAKVQALTDAMGVAPEEASDGARSMMRGDLATAEDGAFPTAVEDPRLRVAKLDAVWLVPFDYVGEPDVSLH
eukprot:327113-Amphidinium_carterae.1